MKNANADVESAHGLIENEFYDIEDFLEQGLSFLIRHNYIRTSLT